MSEQSLKDNLAQYLSEKRGKPIKIEKLMRLPGGASRETWRFDAHSQDGQIGLIVRIDPERSLIDTERRIEFAAMRAAHLAGLPVPEPLDCEEDTQWLGRSFSTSVEMPGSSRFELPTLELREKIAQQKWSIMGSLARIEITDLDLGGVIETTEPELCAREQLEYWANIIVEDELHPNPFAHAAIRWLRRNLPPAPKKLCLVHGDFRTGNFLCTADGNITAILDWEMAHIGDPLEDLAWSFDPLWSWQDKSLVGELVPPSHAIRIWEEASGMKVDLEVFQWWRVFAALKGLGIWISSSEAFHCGPSKSLELVLAGWATSDMQQRVLSNYLSPHSDKQWLRID